MLAEALALVMLGVLTLIVADDAEAERMFAALADGGQVQMPLTKTFFSSKFGMVADRFGVAIGSRLPVLTWSASRISPNA